MSKFFNKRNYLLFTLTMTIVILMNSYTVQAEKIGKDMDPMTVTNKLEEYKKSFLEKASEDKIKDYDEGVKLVAESGVLERAKKQGDIAPEFTLPDATGDTVQLSTVLKNGPVVLIWYRGEWCPYCNIYLHDIQNNIETFKSLNATVIAISPEKPDKAMAMQSKHDLDFHVLSDIGNKTAKEYGVAYTLPPKIAKALQKAFDIHTANGDDSDILPLSASYIINTDGTIAYAYLNADYRERAETLLLIEELKKISK